MTAFLAIILLSALVLVFGVRLIMQSLGAKRRGVSIDDFSNAREAIDLVFVEMAAIKRIFAVEDLEFVARHRIAEARRLFLKGRKKLAMQWLRKIQRQVAELMDLHLRLASYTDEPSPGFELQLGVRYLKFVLVSNAILCLVWLRGPFKSVRTIRYTVHTAGHFCAAFGLRLERVNPTRFCSADESLVD